MMRRRVVYPYLVVAALGFAALRAEAQTGEVVVTNLDGQQRFTADQLDNLTGPIALYPDALLAQVLVAATFPDQLQDAAAFVRTNGTDNIDSQNWDISVKAVAHYPSALNTLAGKIDWTTALGKAYAMQSSEVMQSIQRLRAMAAANGNLNTTTQQQIIIHGTTYEIVPAQPRVIFVPVYDPYVIFARPIFNLSFVSRYWSFGVGFPIGGWLSYDCDWGLQRVYYNGWAPAYYSYSGNWRARSRPYVRLTDIYVSPRYRTVYVNRNVVTRFVDYRNVERYTSVHRDTHFDGRRDHRDGGRGDGRRSGNNGGDNGNYSGGYTGGNNGGNNGSNNRGNDGRGSATNGRGYSNDNSGRGNGSNNGSNSAGRGSGNNSGNAGANNGGNNQARPRNGNQGQSRDANQPNARGQTQNQNQNGTGRTAVPQQRRNEPRVRTDGQPELVAPERSVDAPNRGGRQNNSQRSGQPVQGQPLQGQPIHGQPLQGQPMQGQTMQMPQQRRTQPLPQPMQIPQQRQAQPMPQPPQQRQAQVQAQSPQQQRAEPQQRQAQQRQAQPPAKVEQPRSAPKTVPPAGGADQRTGKGRGGDDGRGRTPGN